VAAPCTPPPAMEAAPTGMPPARVDDRRAMDAICFVLRTGCQWNALNHTAYLF
jgi:transposase